MPLARLAPLAVVAVLVAGCTAGGASAPGGASPSAIQPSPPAAATRIEVRLTDALRIEPAMMAIPVGQPVTFVVTNVGVTDHEFFLGDQAEQAEHEKEMAGMGGMAHDEEMGIGVKPGETKQLTYTFAEIGETLAGCHVAGHYAGGMMATITVRK